jgi:hypothetical protein
MPNTYFQVYDPTGKVQIAPFITDYHKLERSRAEMQIGQMVATLPVSYSPLFILGNDVRVDTQIRIFRSIAGNPATLDLETFWFVQEAAEIQDTNGQEYLEVRAVDAIGVLNRRVVPYEITDAKSDKTGYAGNLMKAFVRENFGALATDVTRDLSAYLTVAADINDGALMDVAVQRPTVLAALQEIAGTSAKQLSYISFDILCDPVTNMMEFTTFPNFRGNDHRLASGNQILVGRNRGNLTNVKLTFSTMDETNYVYAFGGSIGAVKIYEERQDPTRVLVSPFNRREYILNDGNEIDLNVLDDQGDSYIRTHRPRQFLTGDLVEIDGFAYDLNYGFGDYLTIDDRDRSFDARLSAISITDDNGESIKAGLAGDSV